MKYRKWHLMFDHSAGAPLCQSKFSRCEPIVDHCPCFVLHCHTEIEGVHGTLIRIPPKSERYHAGFDRICSLKGDATRPMCRRLFQNHPDSKSTVNLDLMRNHLVLAGLRPLFSLLATMRVYLLPPARTEAHTGIVRQMFSSFSQS